MARACRLDGGSCSITTWSPRQCCLWPDVSSSMSLAQFADASFAYPGTEILAGASMLIRPGDRLALLAPTGAGKSTVLRLLAGDMQADAGDVRVRGGASVAYLRQSQELSGAGTLLDALLEPFAELQRLHEQLIATEAELHAGDTATLGRYGEMQERYQNQAVTSWRRGSGG